MKIDGGIGFDPTGIAEQAAKAEASGYDGVWSAETAHDPFLPIAIGAGATEKLEFGTGITVAFAAQPDDARRAGQRPAAPHQGALHAGDGEPDQAAHHEALLHAVVAPGPAHARDDPRHPGHLEDVGDGRAARLPGRLLHAHADDPVLRPGQEPLRQPQDPPGRGGRAHDGGGGRGRRRVLGARVHHRALPARGQPARARTGRGEGGQDA